MFQVSIMLIGVFCSVSLSFCCNAYKGIYAFKTESDWPFLIISQFNNALHAGKRLLYLLDDSLGISYLF